TAGRVLCTVLGWGLALDAFCCRSTLTQAPPVTLERTSTSAISAVPPLYQRKNWSKSSVTELAVLRLITGVISSSFWAAAVPALSLSTMATGATSGEENVRAPGLAVVQVAAAPPPLPPSTTVQVAGIPEAKLSFS